MQPTILLSALLAKHHTKTAKSLCQMFDKHVVKYELLETKDIWMRTLCRFCLMMDALSLTTTIQTT